MYSAGILFHVTTDITCNRELYPHILFKVCIEKEQLILADGLFRTSIINRNHFWLISFVFPRLYFHRPWSTGIWFLCLNSSFLEFQYPFRSTTEKKRRSKYDQGQEDAYFLSGICNGSSLTYKWKQNIQFPTIYKRREFITAHKASCLRHFSHLNFFFFTSCEVSFSFPFVHPTFYTSLFTPFSTYPLIYTSQASM